MEDGNMIVGQEPEKFGQKRRIPKLPMIVVAVFVGLIGGYVLISSFAATPTTNCFSKPSNCGYPDATNTGVPAGTALTASGSITASTPGQVINAKDVTGTIEVDANNVTIENTRVTLNSGSCGSTTSCGNFEIRINEGVTGTIIKNSELRTANGITCEHDIRNTSSGTVQIIGDYLHGCDSNLYNVGDATMTDTYGLAQLAISTDHVENIYFDDSNMTVNHSTLFNPIGQTAVVFGNSNGGSGDNNACKNHLSVNNSLFAGGGFTIYPCAHAGSAGSSAVSVTNTHFARCLTSPVFHSNGGDTTCQGGPDSYGYYPGSGDYGVATNYFSNQTWSGNTWDDNGQSICADGNSGCAGSGSGGGTTDTTPPTVSITAPSGSATVSGSVNVTANASDNTGVTGVQFKLDGNNLGSEDTSSPYSTAWNTSTASNGAHTLTAVARDAAGNTKTSSSVSVTVNNTTTGGGTGGGTQTSNCFSKPSACGYPDATNTGVPAGTALTSSGSITASTNGQVIDGKDITGQLVVNAPNVTIKNSKIHTNNGGSGETAIILNNGATNFTLQDSEVYGNGSKTNAPESGVWNHYGNSGFKVLRSYIHGSPDNIEGPANVQDSYLIVDAEYNGAHSENIYLCGAPASVTHSTMYNQSDETSLIFGDGICDSGNQVSVTNSLLSGGGWMLQPDSKGVSAPVTITNNRVGRCVGAASQDSGGGYVCKGGADSNGYWPYGGHYGLATDLGNSLTWSGNVWDDNSKTICPTQDGTGSCSSGSGGGGTTDTTKPTVSISAPANGSTVSGTVTSTASASDNVGVSKVEFYLDSASSPAMSDTSSPYNYSFDSKTLVNGSHKVTAKAYDAAGNIGTATSTFTVNNADTTPPSTPTSVKATAASATTVNLSWNASTDASGIAKYNVLRNGVVIAQPTGASYSDTTTVASTTYSYVIQAVDGAGNVSANSTAANVTTPKAGGGSSGSCTTTLSVGANLQNALSGAAPGAVICLNAGNWAAQTFSGIAPSSTVTLQPAPGATVHINGITLNGPGNTKNLTIKGLYIDGGVQGLCGIDGNVIFQSNTIQHINAGNAFYFYANGCGGSHVQTGISMLNNQMDHVGECLTVAGGASIEKNFTFKNNVCGPDIGAGVTKGNQYSHYIEIGCMAGGAFDNNAFLGPYDATALSNTDTATAVHNNVFHCFGDGSDISFSNNILWHTQSRAQTVLVQSGKMDNITIHNNLFVNDPFCHTTSNNCPAQDIEVYAAHGLNVTNNTIAATSWGLHFPSVCNDGCYASGTNETLTNNIVEASPTDGNADYSEWGCASGCVTGSNVSYDSSAVGSPSVKNWTPSYTSTTWTPHSGEPYSPPPSGYYVAKGLSFSAGWDGTGGPQGSVGTGGSNSSSSDTTPPNTPAGLSATAVSATQVNLSWNASTDTGGSGLAGYNIYRDGNKLNTTPITTTTYGDSTASANTSYKYKIEAVDGAGNKSAQTSEVSATTPAAPDSTPPTVSMTAPANNVTVSGSNVTVSASASDNTGVAGVQFKLDGSNLGSEVAAAPYITTWSTVSVSNGTHTLTAVARDAAGNTKTSSSTTVTVNNNTGGGGSSSCATTVSSTSALQSAFNAAAPGQIVCLANGNYGALSFSGTKASPGVTVQAQNSGQATVGAVSISGAGLTFSNFNTTGEITIQPGSSNITILHNKITGGYFGVDACSSTTTTCNDVKIIGNKFQGPYGEDGIRANRYHDADKDGFGLTVSQNEFTGIVENGNHSDCLQTVWVGDGIDFDHNYEHDNRCQGFFIKDQNSLCGSGTSGVCGTVTHVKVYDNIFTRNNEPCAATAPGCGQPTTIQLFGPEDDVSIDRNTMWGGDLVLTLRDPGWSNVSVTNNVVSRKWTDTTAPFNSTYAASNNLFCNTTYSGSWPDTGFASNCNPSFPGPTAANGDNFMLGGSQGVDWRPSQYTYGPVSSGSSSSDTVKPTASITSPANGSAVSGIVTADVSAFDNVGVAKVEVSIDGSLKVTDTAAPYNYSFDSKTLSNGNHTITVNAYDAAGNSGTATSTFTVNNADTTPPSTPSGLKANAASSTAVNLTWNASTDASGIAKYNIVRNGVVVAQVTGTSYTDTGVVAGTGYSYIVQAVDGVGNVSANSAAATVTTSSAPDSTAPTTPTNLQANAPSDSQVNLTWSASTDTGGSGLAGYNIYRDGKKLNTTPITTTTYGDASVKTSTTYSYKIEAVDGAGNKSAQTNGVSVTTPVAPDSTPPSTPAGLKAAAVSATEVDLSWNASTDTGGSGLGGYNIYRNGAKINAAPITGTTYKDAKVSPNTTYQYSVQAIDVAGNTSDKTSAVSASTPRTSGGGSSSGNNGGHNHHVPIVRITVYDNHRHLARWAVVTLHGQTKRTNGQGVVQFNNVPTGKQNITVNDGHHTATKKVNVKSDKHSSTQHLKVSLASATTNPVLLLVPVVILIGAALLIFKPWGNKLASSIDEPLPIITSDQQSVADNKAPQAPGAVYTPQQTDNKDEKK